MRGTRTAILQCCAPFASRHERSPPRNARRHGWLPRLAMRNVDRPKSSLAQNSSLRHRLGVIFFPIQSAAVIPDLCHLAALGIVKRLIPLWKYSNPLHCEILQYVEKLPEIVTCDFDIMSGKCDSHGFAVLCTHQGCSDELAVRKQMDFAIGGFDAQAGGGSLTLPARWRGRTGVVFEMSLH
jgi:hypothetical protein